MQGCGFFKTWCHVCVYLGLDLEKRVRFCGGLFLEVTLFFRIKKSGHRAYVQIVENKRFDGAVRQSVIANLGRADDLIASGALASLLASGAKFTDQVLLITTLDEDSDGSLSVAAKRIGGPLLFGRIWERLGIADVLGELLKHRAFEFAVERAVFVGTLHRLFVSGCGFRRLRTPVPIEAGQCSDRSRTAFRRSRTTVPVDGFHRVMTPGLRQALIAWRPVFACCLL